MTEQKPVIINLCPTGVIPRKKQNPQVPISPKEVVADVKRCYELGVSMVHLHARDAQEDPTWRPEPFKEMIAGIREIDKALIVVVTSSGRNWSELEKRSAALEISGPEKPDMASLTLGSFNFPKQASVNPPDIIKGLAQKMNELQVVPELEAFDLGMVHYSQYLVNKGFLKPPFYYNLLLGSLGTVNLDAAAIGAMIGALPTDSTWSLAGIGRYQLQANTIALALGGHVRIGLEDNPYYNWNTRETASNPRLVERIIRLAKELGRPPASPKNAREIIGI